MLHAAAMLAGLVVLGLLFTQGWSSREAFALVCGASLASVALAWRLGGIARNPFSAAPQMLALVAARAGRVLRGALATLRAALAADVTLKPALVRVRVGEGGAFANAALADALSAAPGSVVVAADAEGMMAHVLDEDAGDAEAPDALQRRADALLGGRS